MALSYAEKALADAAYNRLQLWRKYRGGGMGGAIGGIAFSLPSLIKLIADPHTSHRAVVFFSCLWGFVFGACFISSIFLSRQRKRDEDLVRFFEDRFPDDCSWKQEEKILAQVEDLRLKAKVDFLIHQAGR